MGHRVHRVRARLLLPQPRSLVLGGAGVTPVVQPLYLLASNERQGARVAR